MQSKGSVQLFPTRVFDLHGCTHVGFVQSRGLVHRDIFPVLLEFNDTYYAGTNTQPLRPGIRGETGTGKLRIFI